MDKQLVYCSCGLWHDIKELEKRMKFDEDEIPDVINCSECPICNDDDDLEDEENGEDLIDEA